MDMTLADAASIRVFSKAASSFADLGPLKMEHVGVEGEAVVEGEVAVVGKAENNYHHYGQIQRSQHHGKIAVGKKLFPERIFS